MKKISIHALLAESDDTSMPPTFILSAFLSTLSLRRATANIYETVNRNRISIHALLAESDLFLRCGPMMRRYFYPRSPCGERPYGRINDISRLIFLSTLSLRRATTDVSYLSIDNSISIHALLAESDAAVCKALSSELYFYPRSPCGERPARSLFSMLFIKFLSTLSLRRATRYGRPIDVQLVFLSTLSLRRATAHGNTSFIQVKFLSTLSLRRATVIQPLSTLQNLNFYPRSPCGERR